MKEKLKTIFRRPLVIYPLLFAVFPILFLYAHNIREMAADQIVIPLAVSVLFTLLLWAILSLVLQSLSKAGLATAIFLFLFFSYGRFYELLEIVPGHGHLLPAVLLIFGYCVYFIRLARRDFRITTKILNIMAVALIAINLCNIGFYQVRTALSAPSQPAGSEQAAAAAIDPEKLKTMPDIYFIILDEYAHPDTMREYYDYDNSRFIKSLEDKGFFIANQSKTRTPATPQIIAQVLNMEYFTEGWKWNEDKNNFVEMVSGQQTVPSKVWNEATFQRIAFNKVVDFLRSKGYKWVYFGAFQAWEPLMKANADLYFNYYLSDSNSMITEFQNILWKTTMIRPFYTNIIGSKYIGYYQRGVTGPLEHLKHIPELEGPIFVFAYFLCPHAPFAFGPNGEFIHPDNHSNFKDKQFYLGQYIFITSEIQKVVDALLKKSKTPPIIILQSDHGLRRSSGRPGFAIDGNAWHKILNAMYLPGIDKAVLYESISPVNTFRLIFNHYFGADYPLLEDD